MQAEIAITRELGQPVAFLQPVDEASLETARARKRTWPAWTRAPQRASPSHTTRSFRGPSAKAFNRRRSSLSITVFVCAATSRELAEKASCLGYELSDRETLPVAFDRLGCRGDPGSRSFSVRRKGHGVRTTAGRQGYPETDAEKVVGRWGERAVRGSRLLRIQEERTTP